MTRTVVCFIGMVLLVAAGAHAAPVLVGFPPPGGVSFVGGGAASGQGSGDPSAPNGSTGRTNNYTTFNPIAGGYTNLWWGPTALSGPLQSISGSGTAQPFTLTSIVGNEAIFNGANKWQIQTTFGIQTVDVRLALETFTTGGAPLALTDASLVPGLTGSLGVVLDVTPDLASGFAADYVFEAFNGTAWVGVDDYFNSLTGTSCTNCVSKSVNFGFWTDNTGAAAVPEPASLVLLGTGLLGVVRRVRRVRAAK